MELRLRITTLEGLQVLSNQLAQEGIEVWAVSTRRVDDDQFEVEYDLRLPRGASVENVLQGTRGIPEVVSIEAFTTLA